MVEFIIKGITCKHIYKFFHQIFINLRKLTKRVTNTELQNFLHKFDFCVHTFRNSGRRYLKICGSILSHYIFMVFPATML